MTATVCVCVCVIRDCETGRFVVDTGEASWYLCLIGAASLRGWGPNSVIGGGDGSWWRQSDKDLIPLVPAIPSTDRQRPPPAIFLGLCKRSLN